MWLTSTEKQIIGFFTELCTVPAGFSDQFSSTRLRSLNTIQATTVIVETVIVESTVLVEQKPLTKMQFYLLQTTILVETTVIVEQKTLTVFPL